MTRTRTHEVLCVLLSLWALSLSIGPACAGDWPTYNHDARRSAATVESLNPAGLTLRWTYTSPTAAQPAWPGPAPRDFYNSPGVDNADRLDLDAVFHVAVAGNRVYFGSAAEDTLWCLDAETGKRCWGFTADGPVRFAPHVVDGRVYVGADDGFIYCLSAADGEPVWKSRAAPSPYQVPSDGKVVSLWPNRTGVIVRSGIVYCGVGVFPAEGVYICALDARTGADAGPGLYRKRFTDMSLQGYVLASEQHLYFPGGRSGPWVFARAGGQRKGQFGGGGGTYAVISGTDSIIYGPGKTSPVLEEFAGATRDKLATFPGGRHLVVTEPCTYIATGTELMALDRSRYLELGRQIAQMQQASKKLEKGSSEHGELARKITTASQEREDCYKWRVPSDHSDALILAGAFLYGGGRDSVQAFRAHDGSCVWQADVSGIAKGLAVASGRLFVSTDSARIYCFH